MSVDISNNENIIGNNSNVASTKVRKPVNTTASTSLRYSPGNYTSDIAINVVKKMSYKTAKSSNGNATKVYGSWFGKDNIISFRPGQVTNLSAADLENASIKNMIANGTIRRVI